MLHSGVICWDGPIRAGSFDFDPARVYQPSMQSRAGAASWLLYGMTHRKQKGTSEVRLRMFLPHFESAGLRWLGEESGAFLPSNVHAELVHRRNEWSCTGLQKWFAKHQGA